MAGGELFAEIVMVAGLVVAGTWIVWIMIKARDDLRRHDESAWGDVVELPAAARKAGGAAQGRSDGLAQGLDRTHSEETI